MNKILFLEWKSYGNDFIIQEFQNAGYEVEIIPFFYESKELRNSQEVTERLATKILETVPVFVFSFNYFPVAAIACKACKTKYVSWIYDSPYILLYSKTIEYDTNRVFLFDKAECQKFWNMGIRHVYYLPLGAATDFYDQKIVEKIHHIKYDSEVAFIGSMYSEKKQNMFRHFDDLDSYTKGYLDALLNVQKDIYGMDILEAGLTPQVIEKMLQVAPISKHGDGLEKIEWVYANYFLARRVTAIERKEILLSLSETSQVKLYTYEKTPELVNVTNMGKIDYYEEAPYAIKCAKINLNISLRSIHAGIPLRAIDIMSCGGFLLTNYQADLLDDFIPGEDFVYYENTKEVKDIVRYYLEHEEERVKIAENGYRKVKDKLHYSKQVKKILESI